MILEAVFQGPGNAAKEQYLMEIMLIIFGAFLLGYLFRFFLSDKHKREIADLNEQLAEANSSSDLDELQNKHAAELKDIKAKNDQLNMSLSNSIAEKIRIQAALDKMNEQAVPVAMSAPVVEAKDAVPKLDDLTKIEGVGPKICSLLSEGGIKNFAVLSESSSQDIRAILIKAGATYAVHDPSTWPEQARLAMNEEWEKLSKLQKDLKGGKRKS